MEICVENQDLASDGICTIVEDNIGSAVDGIHIPFFGLNPNNDYTITLTDMTSGFVFDDLIRVISATTSSSIDRSPTINITGININSSYIGKDFNHISVIDAIPSCCKLEYEIGTIILAYKCDKNKTSLCILVF